MRGRGVEADKNEPFTGTTIARSFANDLIHGETKGALRSLTAAR
jgi:hypothetical protein